MAAVVFPKRIGTLKYSLKIPVILRKTRKILLFVINLYDDLRVITASNLSHESIQKRYHGLSSNASTIEFLLS